MFFVWYSNVILNVIPFFLLNISNKICYWVLIETIDDIINFRIYLWSSSKAMADRQKKREGQKYKKLNISRMKELCRWNLEIYVRHLNIIGYCHQFGIRRDQLKKTWIVQKTFKWQLGIIFNAACRHLTVALWEVWQ